LYLRFETVEGGVTTTQKTRCQTGFPFWGKKNYQRCRRQQPNGTGPRKNEGGRSGAVKLKQHDDQVRRKVLNGGEGNEGKKKKRAVRRGVTGHGRSPGVRGDHPKGTQAPKPKGFHGND